MKMLVTVAAIALVSTLAVVHAVGADGSDRPPGVSVSEWAPVSASLGIVLVPQSFAGAGPAAPIAADGQRSGGIPVIQPMNGAVLASPANGYFMVKRGGRWVRLVVVEPYKGPGDAG
jgi:hypothetical protein